MSAFGTFSLDREGDLRVDLSLEDGSMRYVISTPNHHTGNLITNLARVCRLPVSEDSMGLKVICGQIPCFVDGDNREVYIFRLGSTKVANIFPDGTVERKASVSAIVKTLMSQSKDFSLPERETLIKSYIPKQVKFRTDVHTHMNGILEPDILMAMGIMHEIRYPFYYVRKLGLELTGAQLALAMERRKETEAEARASGLTGRYLERRMDDLTYLNFADIVLGCPEHARENLARIRNSLTVIKDGQAVFANLEKVYLYRYVFTKGRSMESKKKHEGPRRTGDRRVDAFLARMEKDRENPAYADNTLFQDKLLWIARSYRDQGIMYAEISDTTLSRAEEGLDRLKEIHAVMPEVTRETGVTLRFLAGIRRIPLTIVRDQVTPGDYLAENLRVLRAFAPDPYVAGADILGEEINDILELRPAIRELVRIADETPGFVIRIHAGENDSLRENVENSIRCVREALREGQAFPPLRIGHGLYTAELSSPRGRRLLEELHTSGAVLEFQLTSNVRLNNLTDLARHPLKTYLKAGIPCIQGTDGAALYGTNALEEQLALTRLLGLTDEDMMAMRCADARVLENGMRTFQERIRTEGPEVLKILEKRLHDMPKPAQAMWQAEGRLPAEEALKAEIRAFPREKLPVIVAGGSFNNSQHRTVLREECVHLIRDLVRQADPEKVMFVIGHRLTGYEQLLVQECAGRFEIMAIVPTLLTAGEVRRLRESGAGIRLALESTGMGLYKSFAYDIFKRGPSVLLALDGNSACMNLMQEGRNALWRCRTYVNGHCRPLMNKAGSLRGYVRRLGPDTVREILDMMEKNVEYSRNGQGKI